MSIAKIEKPNSDAAMQRPAPTTSFEPNGMEEAIRLCSRLANSTLIPDALRGKPDDVLVILMTGRDFDMPVMTAIRGISVIKGKPVMEAALIVGLVRRRRELCRYFRMVSSSATEATFETHRTDEPEPTRLTYTIAEAQAAGLVTKDNWKNFPAAMLRARASLHLARAVYQEVVMNVYDRDELETVAMADDHGVFSAPVVPDRTRPQPANAGGGEVIEADIPDAPAQPLSDAVAEAQDHEVSLITEEIAAATSGRALGALQPRIKAIGDKMARDLLRTAYNDRWATIQAKSAEVGQ